MVMQKGGPAGLEAEPRIDPAVARACSSAMYAETVCAVAAFGGSVRRRQSVARVSWGMDDFSIRVAVMPVF